MLRDEAPTLQELTEEWQAIDQRRRQVAGPLFWDLRQYFRMLADRAEGRIREGTFQLQGSIAIREGALAAEKILPIQEILADLQEVFGEHTASLVRHGVEAASQRVDANPDFDPTDPSVQEVLEALNRQARGISRTTQRDINEEIQEAATENETLSEAADRVARRLRRMADGDKDTSTDISQSRARRIAQTSTTTAFERGQQTAFKDLDMYGMRWLSQRDGRVRRGHLEADGQQVRMGQPFRIAPDPATPDENLRFPGDPKGSPANIINCRCTALPIRDRETFEEKQEQKPDLSNLS